MYRLMNSAMMPQDGTYTRRTFDKVSFGALVQHAYEMGKLISYIGYEQTAEHISRLAGVPIEVSRENTVLEHGDTLLICKLKYRSAPGTKGDTVDEDAFEYSVAEYKEHLF